MALETRSSDRRRVESINDYAVLMGYLSMAIKGLGFLVLTWTTVVLLGGFVSTLHKNDFWSLTFITLVQTAGIFDVVLNEKLSNMVGAIFALLERVLLGVMGSSDNCLVFIPRFLLALIVSLVQVLVLAAVLCPLVIIYVFGILMSGGISVWRLKEHDYRGSDGEASNLPSAMDTLYYLALIQCVLFCYRYVLGRTEKRLASTRSDLEKEVISRYLRDTKKGCEKDPLFAKGRDLTTHAIHLIDSKSCNDCDSGVKMLYTSICMLEREMEIFMPANNRPDAYFFHLHILMKQLVSAATSSGKVLQKLLEMLDPLVLQDGETRKQAAKIVECIACNINLDQFPRGIHYISSLIGMLQEYSVTQPFLQRLNSRGELVQPYKEYILFYDKEAYKELLLRGLCIIRELASSENNCRVISDTQDLVSKIMAPVTSDLLHHTIDDHGEWSNIVEISVEVISRLSGAPGETGAKLRREISSCKEAMSTLERIFSCNVCKKELQEKAIQILTLLYMDSDSSRSADFILRKKEFIRMVLDIFTDGSKSLHVRTYAGAALSGFHGVGNATIVMQTSADAIKRLTGVLLDDEDMVLTRHAAVILEHLWTYYTEQDDYLSVLKTEMSIAVGKIIWTLTDTGKDRLANPQADIETQRDNGQDKETVSSSSASHEQKDDQDEKEKVSGKNAEPEVAKPATDIENQYDNGSGNGTTHPYPDDEQGTREKAFLLDSLKLREKAFVLDSLKWLSSILSLCGMVYDKFISEGSDLTPQFDNASIFLNWLKEWIVDKDVLHTVENLSLLKAMAKMVISMMKDSSGRLVVEREDLQGLIEKLSGASKNMLDLDYSMIFSSTSRFEATVELDKCTLASLVKERQELYATLPSTSGSG